MSVRDNEGNRIGYSASPAAALAITDTVAVLAGDVWLLVIDTATNAQQYGVLLTAPSSDSVSYTADGSATKPEIANGIAAAWNADAGCSRFAVAVSDGVDRVRFYTFSDEVVLAEGIGSAKMTLTQATVETAAEHVPPVLRAWTLRCKLTGASGGFAPGDADDGVITVRICADAAGDIPLTAELDVVTAPGAATATAGGFSASLEGVVIGAHEDREPGRLYVAARTSLGAVTAQWFLDWTDVRKAAA